MKQNLPEYLFADMKRAMSPVTQNQSDSSLIFSKIRYRILFMDQV